MITNTTTAPSIRCSKLTGMTEPTKEIEIDDDTLVSQAGLAEYFQVSRTVVNNWYRRTHTNDFPAPEPTTYIVGNKYGQRPTQVWQLTKVIEWRETYRPRHGAAAHHNASRRQT